MQIIYDFTETQTLKLQLRLILEFKIERFYSVRVVTGKWRIIEIMIIFTGYAFIIQPKRNAVDGDFISFLNECLAC